MTRQLLLKSMKRRQILLPFFAFLFALCYPQHARSESYTLSVGQSITISQTAYNGGYIDNVGLADYLDPHLGFTKNYDGSATITVNSYFDYTTTVKLVFIERYQSYYSGRNHTLAYTYYKDITIKCNYQKPDPTKKPTKVILPERIRVNVFSGGERDYITPILEPNGAKGTKYYWGNDQGTAVFAARTMDDGRCWVTGRSPGIGRVYVVVDDDWDNLYASAVLEVVDQNHLPPNSIFLPSEIEISVSGSSTLTPTLVPENTSTAFTWKSEDESIATVNYGKVTGKKTGTTTIKVTTTNQLTATCTVRVVSRNGKDDEEGGDNNTGGSVGGHDYVDLGLSVKWATCNVGATTPEGFGSYYAWGETTEKSSYTWSTYKHCGGSMLNVYDIGSDIKGTSYDAAYVNWGIDWRMPTENEMGELVSKCTFKEETQNGVDGYLVTGPNGSSVFFPSAGVMKDNKEGGCRYWTSTVHSGDYGMSLLITKNKNNVISPSVTSQMRSFGLPIRAVTTASGSSTVEPKLTLSASPSGGSVEKGTKVYLTAKADGSTVSGCDIYYTTNGNTPTKNSTKYTSSGITINSDCTLKAIAYKDGYAGSEMIEEKYTIRIDQGVQIKAGYGHTLVINNDGELWACGYNRDGQLGNGESGRDAKTPSFIKIMDDVKTAVAGYTNTFIIKNDGSLWGCGDNSSGQLGDSSTDDKSIPIKIMDGVQSVAAGWCHTLILREDGSLWACGYSYSWGEIENSQTVTTPIMIMDNVAKIAAGERNSFIIKKDGSLWAGGRNDHYQLGDGTNVDRNLVKVMDDVDSVATYCDNYYTLFLKKDGSLWGCGINYGQLYVAYEHIKSPIKLGLTNVTSVSAGRYHILALTGETMWATGYNEDGELCDGTTNYAYSFKKIQDNVSAISAGGYYSLFMKKDGTIWSCGANNYGQLGDGTTIEHHTPVQILDGIAIDATNFPDENFRNYLFNQSYGKDGLLTESEIRNITRLSLTGGKCIYSLQGIEYFSALEYLYCGYGSTQLTSLDISKNTALTFLECYGNLLTSLNVSKNTALKTLRCGHNQLSYLDLSRNTELVELSCGSNELTSLDLSKNLAMEELYLSGNQLTSLDVSRNIALKRLNCSYNQLTSLDVSKNLALESLDCDQNLLVSLDLSRNTVLKSLWCCNNQLTSIDVSKNKLLNNLWLFGNHISGNAMTTLVNGLPVNTSSEIYRFVVKFYEEKSGNICTKKQVAIVKEKGWYPCYDDGNNLFDYEGIDDNSYINIPSSGYATFFSSESAYKLPSGLSAKVVKEANNGKLTYETIIIIDGNNTNIVPKGVPVMIESNTKQTGTYTLTATESGATYSGTNLLRGSDEATTTTGDGYHYKLSYGKSGSNLSNVFGWYWGAQNGGAFQIEGHKAWLVVPKSAASTRGFTAEGEATDIADFNVDAEEAVYYDLQGRRIEKPTAKGVYIKNGKKITIK